MNDEVLFNARIRRRPGKMVVVDLEGVGPTWVPAKLLKEYPGEKGDAVFPLKVSVPRWWVRTREDVRAVVARRLAGPVQRARGHFAVRPRAKAAWADLLGTPGAEALRLQRPDVDFTECMREARLDTRDVAVLLGLSYQEVCTVERGLWEFTDVAMWDAAMEAMLQEKRRWEAFLSSV